MIRSQGFQTILLFCSFVLSNTAHHNHFKYTGPNLTTTENETFTEFHLIDHENVFHVTENLNFNNYFSKCCPPNYKYEIIQRKCIKNNGTSIFKTMNFDDVFLIKSGLKDCEVMVDHVLFFNDIENLLGNNNTEIQYRNETFALGQYCLDDIDDIDDENNEKFILRLCYTPEYCRKNGVRCIKKCCRDGEIYIERKCTSQPEYGFPTEDYKDIMVNFTDDFAIFSQKRICQLHFPNLTHQNMTLFENGTFRYRVHDDPWKTFDVEDEMYCLDIGVSNELVTSYLLMCNNMDDRKNIKYVYSKVVMSLSCVCFIATMGVYLFLYKLKKIIHRIVFCYCLAQCTGFTTLTYIQIYPGPNSYCTLLAFVVLFGFHAGFSWLTVMCFDMWRTLGSMSSKVGNQNKSELKKTLYYSMYGWLVPAFITILCYYEHTYNLFPDNFHAYIGDTYCLLELHLKDGNYGHAIFFILPISVAVIANIIFFVLTVRYINEATENVRKMSDSKKQKKKALYALKKRTFMSLKLFLVMGINWSFEIISSVIDFKAHKVTSVIELILDTFNCFQGVFIFLIFVLKWKVIKSIMEKFKLIVVSTVSRSTSVASSSN